MSMRSRYDEIHDKYQTASVRKKGVRYERLAAMVLKSLEIRGIVIHDWKLRGKSGVKSQIDIIVEDKGRNKRRILVECKDFDVGGKDVGIDVVRGFLSVVNDIEPRPDALIISCNNFSPDSIQFATYNKIKLGILSQIDDSDLEDRITKFLFNFSCETSPEAFIQLLFDDKDIMDDFQRCLRENHIRDISLADSGVYFEASDGEINSVNEFVNAEVGNYIRNHPTGNCGIIPVDLRGSHIKVRDVASFAINAIEITFIRKFYSAILESYSERVAEMIFKILGDEAEDVIIFGDDLVSFQIDPVTHEVRKQTLVIDIPGWDKPAMKGSTMSWKKMIGYTFLQIEYSKDQTTNKYVTKGLIVPPGPQQQWLIKDDRIFEWVLEPNDWHRVFSGEFVDTHSGVIDEITEDISTPQKMAAYLEKTAANLSQPLRDLIFWILAERGGKMERNVLRTFLGRDYAAFDSLLRELEAEGKIKVVDQMIILI